MADELEAVDAAEVAALERAADGMPSHAEAAAADALRDRTERALKPHVFEPTETGLCALCTLALAAKLHVYPSGAYEQAATLVAKQGQELLEREAAEANRPPLLAPKGALESLVETLVEQAVGARLDALARELQATRRYALHTMHLVVVLADRFNVTSEQLAGAYQATQEAEAAQGRRA